MATDSDPLNTKANKDATRGRPLIPLEWGPVVGAAITAAASLLIYSFQQIRHIDERLDELEKEARVLLDGTGAVRPSDEALRSFFAVEHLKERVSELERKSDTPAHQ